jgi:hypothetical protein
MLFQAWEVLNLGTFKENKKSIDNTLRKIADAELHRGLINDFTEHISAGDFLDKYKNYIVLPD